MATVYRWWAALVFAAVVVQFGLAGVGAFRSVKLADDAGNVQKHTLDDFWTPHGILGSLIVLGALVLAVLAAAGYRAELRRSGILLALTIVQMLLAWLAGWKGALGFLHPLNALAIFAVSGMIAHRVWRPVAGRETVPA